jgi:hypothetical protein
MQQMGNTVRVFNFNAENERRVLRYQQRERRKAQIEQIDLVKNTNAL